MGRALRRLPVAFRGPAGWLPKAIPDAYAVPLSKGRQHRGRAGPGNQDLIDSDRFASTADSYELL